MINIFSYALLDGLLTYSDGGISILIRRSESFPSSHSIFEDPRLGGKLSQCPDDTCRLPHGEAVWGWLAGVVGRCC